MLHLTNHTVYLRLQLYVFQSSSLFKFNPLEPENSTKMISNQRISLALVSIFFCYCLLVALDHQKLGFTSYEDEELQTILEFTDLEASVGKSGREFWNLIRPKLQCPRSKLSRVGNPGDGGKWTCGLVHLGKIGDPSCLVYSFGVSRDSSFEAEVLENTLCSVYAYDPSVDQIGKPLKWTNPRVHFFKRGIGGEDTGIVKTLKTMMLENGHENEWIDILKVDVEGAEFSALVNILMEFDSLPFGQLLVEVHAWQGGNREKTLKLLRDLEGKGMRIFAREINEYDPISCSEFSLINVRRLERFLGDEDIKKLVNNEVSMSPSS